MVGKTAAERMKAMRQRKQEGGLARYEFWLTKEQAKKVARYILKLHAPKHHNQEGK